MSGSETMTVTKKRVLVDMYVKIDHGVHRYRFDTDEQWARRVEEWAKDFREFVRDHRSQDVNGVNVEREYQEVCSGCGREWEIDEEENPPCCSWCAKPMAVTT